MSERQSGLGEPKANRTNVGFGNILIRVAVVTKTYYTGSVDSNRRPGTVDVRLWEGNKLSGNIQNCFVAQERAGFRRDFHRPYGKGRLPRKDDFVLVMFVDGMFTRPFIIKNLFGLFDSENIYTNIKIDPATYPEEYEDREVELHESGQWKKIDKDGNMEIYFPDGTYIQITDNAVSNPPVVGDLSEEWGDSDVHAAKKIVIKHPSGTYVKVEANGDTAIKSINGDITVETTNGDVQLTAVNVNVNATKCSITANLVTSDSTVGHTHTVTGITAGGDTVTSAVATDKFN